MIPSPVLHEQGVKMSGFPGFSQKFSPFYSSVWLNSIQLPLNLSVSEELCEGTEDNQVHSTSRFNTGSRICLKVFAWR